MTFHMVFSLVLSSPTAPNNTKQHKQHRVHRGTKFCKPRYLNLGTVPVRTGTGTSDLGTQTSDLIWYVVLYNKSKFSAVNLAANDD